ncbi:esterase/lipase family protein [Gordonia metallireducens]|uniref:esterase/lipase family protein n=1 Tax=Gordonia metallireducens TaxID=2897779 RepID=UPI001E5817F8|nr:alpha/beta fold hydrolase [Gordonia metallireducens]
MKQFSRLAAIWPPVRLSVLSIVSVIAVSVVFSAAASADAPGTRNPVILVHGWTAGGLLPPDLSVFEPMRDALESDGHPVYIAKLPGDTNKVNAAVIAGLVATALHRHAGSKVDLVGHSMGGLSTRYYLKYLNGAARADNYVSLGTGQYG